MEKEFIPYEEALEMKELGYEGETLHFFLKRDNGTIPTIPTYSAKHMFGANWNKYGSGLRIAAPLWQQAFRWFREKYNYNAEVGYRNAYKDFLATLYPIQPQTKVYFCGRHPSYEEAQLACLRELIKIVKNEKKV